MPDEETQLDPEILAALEGTGEIRLRDLVKESLRMRPSRIVGR
jgi:Flp pilus assembly CpaF family ATPase